MLVPTDSRKPLGTEEDFATELAEYAAELAPSRFALCLVDDEALDAVVVGWVPDLAVVYLFPPDDEPGRCTLMTFMSIERMRRRVCRDDAVRLVWIEPEPLPHPVSGYDGEASRRPR